MTDELAEARRPIRRLNRIGLSLAALLVLGGGAWATMTRIDGAVVAGGRLVVADAVKTVQHPTGGIVGAILVDEGDRVEAGQVLVRLDGTLAASNLGVLDARKTELTMRLARLEAELSGAEAVRVPAELEARRGEPAVAAAIAAETRLFEARRSGAMGEKAQLAETIDQSGDEIAGLAAQRAAVKRQTELARKEKDTLQPLLDKGLVTQQRVIALERSLAGMEGQIGQIDAETAKARNAIAEAELAVLQVDRRLTTEAATERREVLAELAETEERRVAAADQLARIEIRAPEAGLIHELAVHTVGGVIAPGAPILSIVPTGEPLVVDARVAPGDIDRVVAGAKAKVRVLAGNQRTGVAVDAEVVRVGADLSRDEVTGAVYYTVRTRLAADADEKLGGLELVSGMPTDVFITTGERSPLEFLVEPLEEQIAYAWRER